jgi:hypothetical protein
VGGGSQWDTLLPRFDMPPAVEICFGTRPSQAPKSRPFENTSPLPIAATIALEMTGPTPGTLISRLHATSCSAIQRLAEGAYASRSGADLWCQPSHNIEVTAEPRVPHDHPSARLIRKRPSLQVGGQRHAEATQLRHIRSGRSPGRIKSKNPAAPAVRREAEEDWGR